MSYQATLSKGQGWSQNRQNTSVEDMQPDSVNLGVVNEQEVRVRNANRHPARQEDSQSLPLAGKSEPPNSEASGKVAPTDAGIEDLHLAGDVNDTKVSSHTGGRNEAVEARADEEAADDGGSSVEGG